MQDAEWIADLLQHGLVTASFVPSQEQQDLRDLTRTRVSLVQKRARLVNRVHKILEEAGIKLSTVLSDIMGLSGRAILDALCAGESDPQRLACRVHPSVHATQEQMKAALTAEVREHHCFFLRELLSLIDALDRSIKHLELEIERHLEPFEEQVKRCEKINGVSRHVLHVLLAEVGTDLSRFPDAEHRSLVGGSLPWTERKCRQTTQWTNKTRKSVRASSTRTSCACGFVAHIPTWESAIVA